MYQSAVARVIDKLAIAGEQAGIGVEEMVQMLRIGVSVEDLLNLIERDLQSLPKDSARSIT
jgi:hypothetical protein